MVRESTENSSLLDGEGDSPTSVVAAVASAVAAVTSVVAAAASVTRLLFTGGGVNARSADGGEARAFF